MMMKTTTCAARTAKTIITLDVPDEASSLSSRIVWDDGHVFVEGGMRGETIGWSMTTLWTSMKEKKDDTVEKIKRPNMYPVAYFVSLKRSIRKLQ